MSRCVIDASVIGPLLFQDEADDLIAVLPDILARGEAIVPGHWRLEVANQVVMGARRGRARNVEVALILRAIAALPVEVDPATGDHAWTTTHALAVRHGLTIYDAAYLELAMRMSIPLATADTDLIYAANTEAVPLIT
ncbi:MAG: type II toxin-antitoxin system VapC family toxin [Sphingomonadaceae bacterium]|nr:type II toxin-antitoxin system VapC family toxin [Sphingomonadaceae bacterium]